MDLQLRVGGDASGATAALGEAGAAAGELGDDVGKSVVKWQELANVSKMALEMVVKYGIDAVKAYAESERVQRQLTRVAGEYAGALDEQAQALMRLNAVDDDIIKQSAMLLTQWGGVGAATKEVQQAILDYAAATGQDAVAATQDLIRNVESGGVGLAKMGVHFKATGDKGHDLTAAVEALSKKFGGAGEADASSLSGSMHAVSLAAEDLEKSVGGMLSTVLTKSGALDVLTGKLHEATKGFEILFEVLPKLPGMAGGILRGDIAPSTAIDDLKQTALDALMGGKPHSEVVAPGLNTVTGLTNKGVKAAAGAKSQATLNDEALEAAKKFQRGLDELDEHAAQREEDAYARELEDSAKKVAADIKEVKDREKVREDMFLKIEEETAKHNEKLAQEAIKAQDKAAKEAADAAKKREHEWKQTGDAIGAAFVNALSTQLEKLSSGGEFDVTAFMGDILAATAGIAATAIGTYLGAPAIGAAVGNLAAMGIHAGFSGLKGHPRAARTYHSGGWVGDEAHLPRYHSGNWIGPEEQPAILQHGERVLSRSEVAGMGGSQGVENMVRGGGASRVVVNVTALDAKSAAESFESEVGKGLRRALRSGRGDMPALFGMGGPR